MKWFGNSDTDRPLITDPKVWLGEDGIIRVDYGESAVIDAAMIERVYQKHIALSNRPTPVMFFGTGRPSSTKDGRDASKTERICKVTSAVAFVTDNWYIRKLIDVYLAIDNPPYPVFICANEQDGADWLKRYVEPRAD